MPTYTPLQSIQLTENTSSVTFGGIPQIYQDLVIVTSVKTSALAETDIQFNNDTGSNYSYTRLLGSGTEVVGDRGTNQTKIDINYSDTTAGIFPVGVTNIMNYSNSTTCKTVLVRWGNTGISDDYTAASVGVWRNNSAITSIKLFPLTGSFTAGSTFDLYGISPVAAQNASASGGTDIFYDSTYVYHVFRGSGTFTPYRNLTCDYLVIAGGGGGGENGGGGGGAGGLRSTVGTTGGGGSLESALSLTANTAYTVTIGAGGAGGGPGTSGSNSVFNTVTSTGGGRAGQLTGSGVTGGSGGGGGSSYGSAAGTGGSFTANQGYAGATGKTGLGSSDPTLIRGGGGGGAGGAGVDGNTSGNGGAGVTISALSTATGTGVSSAYTGGGGGGSGTAQSGGTGSNGGGAGGSGNTAAKSGNTNTGGGGGGGGNPSTTAANGGSGIVIVRYAR